MFSHSINAGIRRAVTSCSNSVADFSYGRSILNSSVRSLHIGPISCSKYYSCSSVSTSTGSSSRKNSIINQKLLFSSTATPKDPKHTDKAPDNFYNEQEEIDQQLLDVANAIAITGESDGIISIKEQVAWENIEEVGSDVQHPISAIERIREDTFVGHSAELESQLENETGEKYPIELTPKDHLISDSLMAHDLAEHLDGFDPSISIIPPEMLNYSIPWKKTEESVVEEFDNFIPNSSREKYLHDRQGDRSCTGKLQKQGMRRELKCHKIDLNQLNQYDVQTLRKFITDDSEILSRKESGLCARCQRKVATTIKRARNFGILPHIGEYIIQDGRALKHDTNFHDELPGSPVVKSKTIL